MCYNNQIVSPHKFAKEDQGVSPVLDYFHINLADFLRIRFVNNADSLGIRHGEQKGN